MGLKWPLVIIFILNLFCQNSLSQETPLMSKADKCPDPDYRNAVNDMANIVKKIMTKEMSL